MDSFIIKIDNLYYAGESENHSTVNRTGGGSGWFSERKELNGILLTTDIREAKIITAYTNLNSHWKRLYEALRYKELTADNIEFKKVKPDFK